MPKPPARREPSYQIGISLDANGQALQPVDPYDSEETAQDHAPPPRADHPSTEVALPADLVSYEADPVAAEEPPPPRAPPLAARAASQSARSARASGDSARAATRSSRRLTSATSTAAKAVSSRRASSGPRGAWQKPVLYIALGLLAVSVLIVGSILLFARESDNRRLATEALAEAERHAEQAATALANRRGSEARQAYEAAVAVLTGTAQLGGAVAMPDEQAPVVRDLALRAHARRTELEPLHERIAALQAENTVAAHLATLRQRLAALGEPTTDVDALERDVLAFIANPVEPAAGASPMHVQTHQRQVASAELLLPGIRSERERRQHERSALPVRLAAGEVDGLVQQERFGDALRRLDELTTKHPDADFRPLRTQAEDAAAKAWRSAQAQVETRLADWRSQGATESQRAAALVAAKERLNQVIQRFGIPTYVDQARTMLVPLP